MLVDGASHFSKWRSAPRTFYSGYCARIDQGSPGAHEPLLGRIRRGARDRHEALTKSGTKRSFTAPACSSFRTARSTSRPCSPTETRLQTRSASGSRWAARSPGSRDRTHFLESYEGRRSRTNNIVVSPAASGSVAPDNEDEHLFFFRVDHRATPESLLTSRYNGQFFRWHNERGGLDLPGTGTYYINDVHTWLTTDRHALGGRLAERGRAFSSRASSIGATICSRRCLFRASAILRRAARSGRSDSAPIPRTPGRPPTRSRSCRRPTRSSSVAGSSTCAAHNPSLNLRPRRLFLRRRAGCVPAAVPVHPGVRADRRRGVRRSAKPLGVRFRPG